MAGLSGTFKNSNVQIFELFHRYFITQHTKQSHIIMWHYEYYYSDGEMIIIELITTDVCLLYNGWISLFFYYYLLGKRFQQQRYFRFLTLNVLVCLKKSFLTYMREFETNLFKIKPSCVYYLAMYCVIFCIHSHKLSRPQTKLYNRSLEWIVNKSLW